MQQRGERFLVIRVHRRGRQIAEHLAPDGRAPASKLPLRGQKCPSAVGAAAAVNLYYFSMENGYLAVKGGGRRRDIASGGRGRGGWEASRGRKP